MRKDCTLARSVCHLRKPKSHRRAPFKETLTCEYLEQSCAISRTGQRARTETYAASTYCTERRDICCELTLGSNTPRALQERAIHPRDDSPLTKTPKASRSACRLKSRRTQRSAFVQTDVNTYLHHAVRKPSRQRAKANALI